MIKPASMAKLALAACGIIVFGMGIRLDNVMLRWTGIGVVAAAWLMRFVKDGRDH